MFENDTHRLNIIGCCQGYLLLLVGQLLCLEQTVLLKILMCGVPEKKQQQCLSFVFDIHHCLSGSILSVVLSHCPKTTANTDDALYFSQKFSAQNRLLCFFVIENPHDFYKHHKYNKQKDNSD